MSSKRRLKISYGDVWKYLTLSSWTTPKLEKQFATLFPSLKVWITLTSNPEQAIILLQWLMIWWHSPPWNSAFLMNYTHATLSSCRISFCTPISLAMSRPKATAINSALKAVQIPKFTAKAFWKRPLISNDTTPSSWFRGTFRGPICVKCEPIRGRCYPFNQDFSSGLAGRSMSLLSEVETPPRFLDLGIEEWTNINGNFISSPKHNAFPPLPHPP